MKRQTQAIGVRDWYGMDFLSLQEEPLKVLDNFFTQYGSFIVSGCEITPNGSNYDISPGLVALEGPGADGTTVKVVAPFAGMTNTILPVYITLECETQTDVYHDGKVKPIVNIYKAVGTTVRTTGKTYPVVIRTNVRNRYLDKLQDSDHNFVTNSQITAWNAKASNTLATASQSGLMSAADKLKLDRSAIACGLSIQSIAASTGATISFDDLLFFDNSEGIWVAKIISASGTSFGFNHAVSNPTKKPLHVYVVVRKNSSATLNIGVSFVGISRSIAISAGYTQITLHFVKSGSAYLCVGIEKI